jgi:two-component system, OmpR family, sensor kinase
VSIRLRVTLASVVLAVFALGAVDVSTFILLRSYFNKRSDSSVRLVAQTAVSSLKNGGKLKLPASAGSDRPVLVELENGQGKVIERVASPEAAEVRLPAGLLSHLGHSQQIGAPDRHGPEFQVIAVAATGGTVIAAVSVRNDVNTLAHLFNLNFIVGGSVVALLAVVAAFVLTRSLRPLRRIAATADAIAGGDLAARIPDAPKRSEIGRVATALNRMLSENEAAFAARDATEQRLRQFLADASHELRTPLTSIRGYAELFRRGADQRPEDLAKGIRAIEDEAARMTRLVEDLLLLAQLDDSRPVERQSVALDDVVEASIDAARAVETDRLFQLEFVERPLLVEGDQQRLRQVMDNLLANVRQHTPARAPVLIALNAENEQVVLTVEDSGPGVPAADSELVFERFSRLDVERGREGGGAGLGLAIVRAIVAAHGGEVSVRATRPHGAIFEIRMPRLAAQALR